VHCGNVEVKNKTYIFLFRKGDLLTVFVLVFILRELMTPIFLVYILNDQASPFKSESKYRTNIFMQGYCFWYQLSFFFRNDSPLPSIIEKGCLILVGRVA